MAESGRRRESDYVVNPTVDFKLVDASGNRCTLVASGADGLSNDIDEVVTAGMLYGFNGTTWDRVRVDAATAALDVIDYEHHEIHSNSHYFLQGFTTLASAATLDFCVTTFNSASWPHLVFNFQSSLLMILQVYEMSDFDADGTLAVQQANNRAKTFSGTHTAAGNNATVMTDSAAAFTVDALIGWKIYNITDGSYGIVTDNDGTTVTVAELVGGTDNDWDTSDQYVINRSLVIVKLDCTVNSLGILIASLSGGSGTNPSNGTPGGASRDNEWVLRPNTKYLFRFTSGAAGNILEYNAEWYEHTDKS